MKRTFLSNNNTSPTTGSLTAYPPTRYHDPTGNIEIFRLRCLISLHNRRSYELSSTPKYNAPNFFFADNNLFKMYINNNINEFI